MGHIFKNMSLSKGNKAKINKWDYLKLQAFAQQRKLLTKLKCTYGQEKILANKISGREYKQIISKNHIKSNKILRDKPRQGGERLTC